MDFFEYLDCKNIEYQVADSIVCVPGSLDLRGSAITYLPDNLQVGEWLDLRGSAITYLPDNLQVGEWLDLRGSAITYLPDNLQVGEWLYLDGSAIPVCTADDAGEYERTIYAFLLGDPKSPDDRPDRVRVTAGCFYGRLEEFNAAVDDKYADSPEEADEYKAKMAGIVERAIKGYWD